MPEIPYGRLQALESALGGRERINSAWQRGVPLIPHLIAFSFTYDTPGLNDGVVVYTPKVDESLLDAWVEVDEAWDGTTPNADIGTFVGSVHGLYTDPSGANAIINLGGAAQAVGGLRVQYLFNLGTAALYPGGSPRFISEDPLKLVVSQDGTLGGADPGATQGKAILFLHVAPA